MQDEMATMSFMDFYQEDTPRLEKKHLEPNEPSKSSNFRKPTLGQLKYYTDLCKQRNIKPEETASLDYDKVSAMIKEMLKFYPASPAQLDLIRDKLANIRKLGYDAKTTEDDLKRLTGGREGTASKFIETLIAKETELEANAPITENQLKTIVSYFFCPDIDFESHNIPRRIDIDVEKGLWRKPTPQEFAENIASTFNKKSASEFINQSGSIFYDWKKTRIRPNQLNYIKELEKQLCNDSKLREVRVAVDTDGKIVEMDKSANVQVKGTTYVPHTDEQLIQYSIEQASQFINQLKSEIARHEDSAMEENLPEYVRTPKTEQEALDKEFAILSSMMYKLEAIAGYEDEDLHACATYDVSSSPLDDPYKKEYIRDFIKDMLRNDAITYMGVLELADESLALQQILLDM